jgi:hypothetical protein
MYASPPYQLGHLDPAAVSPPTVATAAAFRVRVAHSPVVFGRNLG